MSLGSLCACDKELCEAGELLKQGLFPPAKLEKLIIHGALGK